jgi:hypothetical protein
MRCGVVGVLWSVVLVWGLRSDRSLAVMPGAGLSDQEVERGGRARRGHRDGGA